MTGPRIERAAAIADTIRAALPDDLADVLVTFDGTQVPQGAPGGAVIVLPPRLTFPTYTQTETTWEVCVTAGPFDNHMVAWDRIDQIIAAIAPGLDFTEAEPSAFQPTAGQALSAYVLTYTDPE
ncbi:hypothetical protein GCM10017714_33630 [Curtobacterium pusillum]|uniref:DUF3168 domain-containing protein n=1 Tax=Curtobacterium pusillum TaxID=69373 RepID=A0ABX2M7F8_9MICO|nr:hypothetical protein [Curtobacterium pusillum]NUU12713.1 hypothetical protein [Curtobacterium pusillum]GLK31603.1 hypothetical protein GCM10017610_18880 [Curtobacterium pusillum]